MSKVRIYCPYFPFPLKEAAWQSMFNQALAIHSLGHEVEIVSWKTSPEEVQEVLKKHKDEFPRQLQITVFSKAGSVRGSVIQWLNLDRLPKKFKERGRLGRVMSSLGKDVAAVELQYYPSECDQRRFLEDADLEIYHYSFAYHWLKNKRSFSRRRVVHFHNLESDLFQLRAQQTANPVEKILHRNTAHKLRRHELNVVKLCDEVWQHAEQDLIELRSRLQSNFVGRVVSPNINEALAQARQPEKEVEKLRLGFIGGLDFEPNFLSLKWILSELCPELQRAGFQGIVSQVGKMPERARAAAQDFDFVHLEGFVDNVEEWWKSLSFLLVPDVTSAGVRVKILEAIGSGVPVIANQRAVDRLHSEVKKSPLLIVKEEAKDWAEFILSQRPLGFRKQFLHLPMNEGLRGSAIYGFLNQV